MKEILKIEFAGLDGKLDVKGEVESKTTVIATGKIEVI